MIRHFQIERNIETGDCLRACIASIFDVADPLRLSDFRNGRWWENARAWVRGHTSGALDLCFAVPHYPLYDGPAAYPAIAVLSSAVSGTHAVIVDADSGTMIHDPAGVERTTVHPLFLIAVCTPAEADARSNLWTDQRLAQWFPLTIPSVNTNR